MAERVVVALDPSSQLLAFYIWSESKGYTVYPVVLPSVPDVGPAKNAHAAKMATRRVLKRFVKPGDRLWFFIEAPISASKGGAKALIPQARVNGAVFAEVMDHQPVLASQVDHSTWKKHIVGSGSASKDDIAAWLRANEPTMFALAQDIQDLVDAACILLLGQRLADDPDYLTRSH